MWKITYLIIVSFVLLNFQQELLLKNKYKMEFEEKYKFQNCNIEFNKKTYIRNFSNGNKIKGEIFENNFEYVLKEKTTSLQIHILKEDLNKDTVFFMTKDINDKVKENELELYSGKLIIIK